MKAPKLNRRLQLLSALRTRDDAGGHETTWQVAGVLWAEVKGRSATAAESAELNVAKANYRIIVRGAPEGAASRPVAGQRFRDGTREFDILAVTEWDPGLKYLVCYALEEVAT